MTKRRTETTWRFDGPNVDPRCECPCGTCIDTVGYDPETPCSSCPVHGRMDDAALTAEWIERTSPPS